MFFMVLIMMPLATTEIGTDGWITKIMEGVAEGNFHPGWVLVYTSAIMMVLRFFAGPIVHSLSPLGLLAVSAILAIAGLFMLSSATGAMIFIAATLYGFGKTFFWPTTLGVVAEQTPRGGALTLNAISGIGMLAVGTLGFPYIGTLQSAKNIDALVASDAAQSLALVQDGKLSAVTKKSIYEIIPYTAVDQTKIDEAIAAKPAAEQDKLKADLKSVVDRSNQKALGNMAAFPAVMLVGYLALILFFRSQGGYKAEVLVGHGAQDDKFTGGVNGPADA
jgi:MFS family permease